MRSVLEVCQQSALLPLVAHISGDDEVPEALLGLLEFGVTVLGQDVVAKLPHFELL